MAKLKKSTKKFVQKGALQGAIQRRRGAAKSKAWKAERSGGECKALCVCVCARARPMLVLCFTCRSQ